MGKITDLNITGLHKGKHAASLGDAHEMIVAGLLIRLGFEVGAICVKGTPYDLWIMGYKRPHGKRVPLRAQIKTVSKGKSVRFIAGTRAGINRIYKPGIKKYKFTEKDNDLIIGIDVETLDLYLIPTRFITKWGQSKSIRKLQKLKNNWKILLNWNDKFLAKLEKQVG